MQGRSGPWRREATRAGIGLTVLGIAAVVAVGCEDATEGEAPVVAGGGGMPSGDAGGEGGRTAPQHGGSSSGAPAQSGVGGTGSDEGGSHQGGFATEPHGAGGVSGAGGDASSACERSGILGTHELSVRYEKRLCVFASDDPEEIPPGCGDWEKLSEGTIDLKFFQARDDDLLHAVVDGIGVLLGSDAQSSREWWAGPIFGGVPPNEQTIRLELPVTDGVCSAQALYTSGEARVDLDATTGRVIAFERLCLDEYRTLDWEYRVIGAAKADCDVATCNELVNTAPEAQINHTQPNSPHTAIELLGGSAEVTSGTYYLKSADYPADPSCMQPHARPDPISETLVVTASTPTSGVISLVSERGALPPVRSTFSYEVGNSRYDDHPVLEVQYICGDEVLAFDGFVYPDAGAAFFSASAVELRLQVPAYLACEYGFESSSAIYTYEKQ